MKARKIENLGKGDGWVFSVFSYSIGLLKGLLSRNESLLSEGVGVAGTETVHGRFVHLIRTVNATASTIVDGKRLDEANDAWQPGDAIIAAHFVSTYSRALVGPTIADELRVILGEREERFVREVVNYGLKLMETFLTKNHALNINEAKTRGGYILHKNIVQAIYGQQLY